MNRWVCSLTWSLVLLLASLSSAPAQKTVEDYRQYFKPPDTPQEFWKALNFEIELGAYPVAAEFLKGFIGKAADKDILDIETKEGISVFLNLRTIPKWTDDPKLNVEAKKNVEDLIDKATSILKAHLSDPNRIAKMVDALNASRGERIYAITELRRSGAYVIPLLVKEMLEAEEGSGKAGAIFSALPYLGREAMPGLLAALDVNNPLVQAGIVEGIRQRSDLLDLVAHYDTNPVPHLWHLSASSRHPDFVRRVATATLAKILLTDPDKLPQPRGELIREANRFYQKRVRFADPTNVTLWHWDGKELVSEKADAHRAEEYYGLRYAQKALDLDPTYEPAQIMALSIAVEKGLETAGIDQPFAKAARVKELLTTVNPELVVAALEKALDERHPSAALGMLRGLADLQAVAAKLPRRGGRPALLRAMNYPDRRVQYAAADAMLRIPGTPLTQGTTRVVEILRRSVEADQASRILIGDLNQDRGLEVAKAVKEAGFEPVVVQTGKEVLQRMSQAADIDAVMVDYEIPDPGLRQLIAQLRSDVDMSQAPLIIMIPPTRPSLVAPPGVRVLAPLSRPADAVIPLERMIGPYRNVFLATTSNDPDVIKPLLTERILAAMGKPWTDAERKATAGEAMVWLRRIAVGETSGYSIQPAETAILKAMRNEELAPLAVEAASRLAGRNAQRDLAALVLDDAVRAEVRAAAASELARHIQANRPVLFAVQAKGLQNLFNATEDRRLKANVALVIGALRPDTYRTSDRLKGFVPEPPAAKPEPGMKEKEKEKEKEKDKE